MPPIVAGTVDNSNRSNSEIQANFVFYNTIIAFQNLVAEELNYEMIRKLGWKNVEFVFPEVNKRSETDILKNAKALRVDLHFTEEAIVEYLRQNGFRIPEVDELFDESMDPAVIAQKAVENSNESPSRQPRDKGGLVKNEKMRKEGQKMGVSSDKN